MDRSLAAVADVLATTPHVMFCVKSIDGRYIVANLAFAERAGVATPGEVVGRTAHDLFPADLADRYESQDRRVIETGRTLTNELELITRPDRSIGWYLTSKSRWHDQTGEAAGVIAVSTDLRTPDAAAAPHARLARMVEMVRRRFAESLRVRDLADAADMSAAQLERSTRRLLGLSPKQLIMRMRLEEALRLLSTTDVSIAEVAVACGYYDQSSFARHFRRVVGISPSEHRAATRASDES